MKLLPRVNLYARLIPPRCIQHKHDTQSTDYKKRWAVPPTIIEHCRHLHVCARSRWSADWQQNGVANGNGVHLLTQSCEIDRWLNGRFGFDARLLCAASQDRVHVLDFQRTHIHGDQLYVCVCVRAGTISLYWCCTCSLRVMYLDAHCRPVLNTCLHACTCCAPATN